jgi:uncharacterized protein (DUF342 family)
MVPQEIIEAGKTGKPLPPKQPQPDPMIELKKQELQQRAEKDKMDYQNKVQDLQHKQAEMQRKAIESHQDITMQWEKLEAEKEEAAAQLQEAMLRYKAETDRLNADLEMSHSEQIIKLLTHAGSMHHEKAMQDKDHAHQSRQARIKNPISE